MATLVKDVLCINYLLAVHPLSTSSSGLPRQKTQVRRPYGTQNVLFTAASFRT